MSVDKINNEKYDAQKTKVKNILRHLDYIAMNESGDKNQTSMYYVLKEMERKLMPIVEELR